jgi:hypothetical protein
VVSTREGWRKYVSDRLIVLGGATVLTSKAMCSIRPAEPFNVCRYFSVSGTQDAVAVLKNAWTGSIRRYSWEGVGEPNQVLRMAV